MQNLIFYFTIKVIKISLYYNPFKIPTYYFLENPEYSIPDVQKMSGKSYGKIQRTLKRHKYHPYRFLPVQNLNDEHRRQRLAYCTEILRRYHEDDDFFNKIIFTDEASFTTAGVFNRKNKHFWGMENPHQIQAVKIQGRRSINVWCGMLNNMVLGPIIYEGSLNGERYLHFLENEIEQLLENLPVQQYNNLIWHQDGAPVHNVQQVTNFLNNKYRLWIGRDGTVRWPANSPDLNPCDIFLWGYLKNKVYYNRPESLEVIRQRLNNIVLELNTENPNFITSCINIKLVRNIRICLANNGGYIENI